IRSPSLHQFPPLLQKVRAPISGLDLVWDSVSQRRLSNLAGYRCLLSTPVAKGRPETVHSGCRLLIAKHLEQRHVAQRLASCCAGKHEIASTNPKLCGALEYGLGRL